MSIQFFAPRGADRQIVKLPTSMKKTVQRVPRIGDIFPDFTVDTTRGRLRFRDWAGGHWVHVFSHSSAFTPVCTTEMSSLATYAPEWEAANVRNLALTGSPLEDQIAWHADITALFGTQIDFPCAHDAGLRLSRLFGMAHEKDSDIWPIRKSFLIDPSQRLRMIFEYPIFIGRRSEAILRAVHAMQLRDATGMAPRRDPEQGDMAIIPDDRPESSVLRDTGSVSTRLSPYLRVVKPAG